MFVLDNNSVRNGSVKKMAKVGYARVSAPHQHLDRQIAVLRAERCTKIFREKASAKLVLLARGLPLAGSLRDILLALLHGGVLLAAGLVLFARGSRVVPGVTLVMLAQAETVAAPVWTYLVFNETATLSVIAGGALILTAVMMQTLDGARPVSSIPSSQ